MASRNNRRPGLLDAILAHRGLSVYESLRLSPERLDGRSHRFVLQSRHYVAFGFTTGFAHPLVRLQDCRFGFFQPIQAEEIHRGQQPVGGVELALLGLTCLERRKAVAPVAVAILDDGEGVPELRHVPRAFTAWRA